MVLETAMIINVLLNTDVPNAIREIEYSKVYVPNVIEVPLKKRSNHTLENALQAYRASRIIAGSA